MVLEHGLVIAVPFYVMVVRDIAPITLVFLLMEQLQMWERVLAFQLTPTDSPEVPDTLLSFIVALTPPAPAHDGFPRYARE